MKIEMKIENVNMGYTTLFAIVVSLGFFNMGYTIAYFNSLTFVLHKQYISQFPEEANRNLIERFLSDRDIFNSTISSLVIFGAIIGSIFGGPLAEKGRRRALILLSFSLIINSFILCIFNLYCLMFGRVGCFTVISPLFVKEISPKCIAGPLGAINQLMMTVGTGIALSLAFIVPTNDDVASYTSNSWRILFVAPAIFGGIQLIMLMYFKYDSPTFYLFQRDFENYSRIMSKIYKHSKEEREAEIVKCKEEQHENELSWGQIFSYPYLNSLLVGIILSIIHQATGITLVIFYSNEIFLQGLKGDEAEFSARIGSIFVSIVSFFGVMLSAIILKIYGRKSIMLFGILGICATQFLLAYFSFNPDPIAIIIVTLTFVFIFNLTIGGILWIYASETLSAKGISLITKINFLAALIFGSIANLLIRELTFPIVYCMFGFIQIFAFFFILYCVKETKGLTKDQCERLYFNETKSILSEPLIDKTSKL